MANVKLIVVTPDAERTMGYIARVSNPANQANPDVSRLLRYCIRHGHWSVFEHAHMTVEIETSLAIATQILRHRSFCFQQFSGRYADPLDNGLGFEPVNLRTQDPHNRQASRDDLPADEQSAIGSEIDALTVHASDLYRVLIQRGIAKECARMVLPQTTQTRLYMTGNVRSWIHYIQLRDAEGVQPEHREIAAGVRAIFSEQFPTVAEALEWTEPA